MTRVTLMSLAIKNKKRYGDKEYDRISLYEINKSLKSDTTTAPEILVLLEYHDLFTLFQKANANKLRLY